MLLHYIADSQDASQVFSDHSVSPSEPCTLPMDDFVKRSVDEADFKLERLTKGGGDPVDYDNRRKVHADRLL